MRKKLIIVVALAIICFVPANLLYLNQNKVHTAFVSGFSIPKIDLGSQNEIADLVVVERHKPATKHNRVEESVPSASETLSYQCSGPRPLVQGSGEVVVCEWRP